MARTSKTCNLDNFWHNAHLYNENWKNMMMLSDNWMKVLGFLRSCKIQTEMLKIYMILMLKKDRALSKKSKNLRRNLPNHFHKELYQILLLKWQYGHRYLLA